MNLQDRILLFSALGDQIKRDPNIFFEDSLNNAKISNSWFTKDNIDVSVSSILKFLEFNNLLEWVSNYSFINKDIKSILIIMAGNIPFVGLHDLICVLISGNKAIVKMSSKDNILIETIINNLILLEPKMKDFILITKDVVKANFDAIIATGSDNSSKYFDYYFKSTNSIIRKNRRSIAILDGTESDLELNGLADDVFLYFGLGCRSVSKLFLPVNYDLDKLLKALLKYSDVINHQKYSNNYDYNKTIYLMNKENILDNGFILLKEDVSIQSPISMLFYEFYNSRSELDKYINDNSNLFQCIISKNDIDFGQSQFPKLDDYADNIDTLEFLSKL
ncbi:MAG: acyl-CoA reductase [Flavobacteriales bacterium]|jgi:hypothetical protein|nr:acyl-CoA reductase [Flavobacteriales bacterium]